MLQILLSNHNLIIIFLAGFFGALVADLIKDNCIELPKKIGNKFFLGSFGGLIIGGFAGLAIDGSFLTAFMGGFMGKELITSLVSRSSLIQIVNDENTNTK